MALIGISGKINSGKDTVGKIIQYLTISDYDNVKHILRERNNRNITLEEHFNSFVERDYKVQWEIKKIADKLKDIVCILIGCTREQLEDREFKEKELGPEWWYFKGRNGSLISYNEDSKRNDEDLIKPTPRLLLQLLGTECGREILHPNIWCNSFFSDYIPNNIRCNNCYWYGEEQDLVRGEDEEGIFDGCPTCNTDNYLMDIKQSKWIITDMRYPNELKAVKDRGGITIRVNRPYSTVVGQGNGNRATFSDTQFHPSETSLDSATFDFIINNDKDIEHLINEVKKVLEKSNII